MSLRPGEGGLESLWLPSAGKSHKWKENLLTYHHLFTVLIGKFIPFSSRLQSFPASGSFPVCQFFTLSGPSIGASALASVLAGNVQGWFLLVLVGFISLQSKGLSRVFSSTTVWKHQFFGTQPSLWSNSHLYTATEKAISLTKWAFVGKVTSLLFNMLSRFVITFLPRRKHLLISVIYLF